jgi:hypothetical protein
MSWSMVDLDHSRIRIPGSITKTRIGRTIDPKRNAVAWLSTVLKGATEVILLFGDQGRISEPVYCSNQTPHYNISALDRSSKSRLDSFTLGLFVSGQIIPFVSWARTFVIQRIRTRRKYPPQPAAGCESLVVTFWRSCSSTTSSKTRPFVVP